MKLGITILIASMLSVPGFGAHVEGTGDTSTARGNTNLPEWRNLADNFTKAGNWAVDGQKTERQWDGNWVKIKFSKTDATWLSNATNDIRKYRWNLTNDTNCTGDKSAKAYAWVLDYCFPNTAIGPVVNDYIKAGKEAAAWMRFNVGDLAACRGSVDKVFAWKKAALKGRDLLASDIEFKSRMDRFFEIALGTTKKVEAKWSDSAAKDRMLAIDTDLQSRPWKEVCHFQGEEFSAAVGDGGAGAGSGCKGGYGSKCGGDVTAAVPGVQTQPQGFTGGYGGGGYGGYGGGYAPQGGGYNHPNIPYGMLGGLYNNKGNYNQPTYIPPPPPPPGAPGAVPPPPPPPFFPGGIGVGVGVRKNTYPPPYPMRPPPYPPFMPPPFGGPSGGPPIIAPYVPEPTPIVRVTVNDNTLAKPSPLPIINPLLNRPMPYPNLGMRPLIPGMPMPMPYPSLWRPPTMTVTQFPTPIFPGTPTFPGVTPIPIGPTTSPVPSGIPLTTVVPQPPNRIQIPRI